MWLWEFQISESQCLNLGWYSIFISWDPSGFSKKEKRKRYCYRKLLVDKYENNLPCTTPPSKQMHLTSEDHHQLLMVEEQNNKCHPRFYQPQSTGLLYWQGLLEITSFKQLKFSINNERLMRGVKKNALSVPTFQWEGLLSHGCLSSLMKIYSVAVYHLCTHSLQCTVYKSSILGTLSELISHYIDF